MDETPLSAAFIRAPQRNGVIQQIHPEAPFLAVCLELLWFCSGSNVGLFIDQTSLWFHLLFMTFPATCGSRPKTSVDMYTCPHITVLSLVNRPSDPGLMSKNLDKDIGGRGTIVGLLKLLFMLDRLEDSPEHLILTFSLSVSSRH